MDFGSRVLLFSRWGGFGRGGGVLETIRGDRREWIEGFCFRRERRGGLEVKGVYFRFCCLILGF